MTDLFRLFATHKFGLSLPRISYTDVRSLLCPPPQTPLNIDFIHITWPKSLYHNHTIHSSNDFESALKFIVHRFRSLCFMRCVCVSEASYLQASFQKKMVNTKEIESHAKQINNKKRKQEPKTQSENKKMKQQLRDLLFSKWWFMTTANLFICCQHINIKWT